MSLTKIATITNTPAPYREETYAILNKKLKNQYHVYYCSRIGHNRLWKITDGDYNKTFLKSFSLKFKDRLIYFNFDIFTALNKFNPDVVLTSGFFPTMILAFIWSKCHGKKHITLTDGTITSEKHLSGIHRWVRKFVYFYTDAFIGSSKKSMELYLSYNVKSEKLFLSPLCIKNDIYKKCHGIQKKFDIIFSGQFIDRKMPFFFIDVIKLVCESISCKVLLIGSGELKEKMLNKLDELNIEYSYPGFIQQEQMPFFYGSAKILLFPTKYDAWGLVTNEACAAGLPVITCDNAGAANELIIHDYNGFVLPLDEKVWAQHIIKLLSNEDLYKKFSTNALKGIQKYTYENAVQVIMDAAYYALQKK